jgi:hypothetical protein
MISVYRILFHYSSPAPIARLLTSVAVVLALLLGGGAPSSAAETRGLLWKIEGKDQKPSYLFGTIHIADPRVTNLPPPVRAAFDAAERLYVEVVADAEGLARLMRSMRFGDGRTLTQTIGARGVMDAQAALAKRRIPLGDIDHLKPWAIALMLLMPDSGDRLPLDLALQVEATERGIAVEGLETMDEQIAVFDDLPLDDQRALLEVTLRDLAEMPGRIESLTQAYLARDLARLQALAEAEALGSPELHATVMRRLLTDRNRRMVRRMQSRLRRGNAFIAVGAAHLPGPQGLIELLGREGYRLSAVY